MRKVFVVLVVVAAWLSGAQAVAAELTFSPLASSPFATGAGPQSIASGGSVMATADTGANDVTVFFEGVQLHTGPFVGGGGRFPTGLAPASVAVDPQGGFVAVANHGDNTVSMFAVSSVSTSGPGLTPVPGAPFATGVGPQSVAFSSDGRLLAVANRGDNTVSVFSVSFPFGSLTPVPGSPFGVGSSPYSVAFDAPAGTLSPGGFLAVANSASNNVSMFSVSSDGSLTPVPGSPFGTGSSPQSVAFRPPIASPPGDGFLAVANTASNNVSMFSVSSSGPLTPVPGSPFATGRTPLAVDFGGVSGEPLLATANFADNDASVFSVSSSGALAPVAGSPLSLGAGSGPASLTFGSGAVLAIANSALNNVSAFVISDCDAESIQGVNAGFNPGYNSGFNTEYRNAYRRNGSWQVGWKRGFQAARKRHAAREPALATPAALRSTRTAAIPAADGCDVAYNSAFNTGFGSGYNSGFNSAFNLAFRKGYKAGFAKGRRRR